MHPVGIAIICGVALTAILASLRAIELLNGHTPTAELTAAFTLVVTVTVGLLAAGHFTNGGGKP